MNSRVALIFLLFAGVSSQSFPTYLNATDTENDTNNNTLSECVECRNNGYAIANNGQSSPQAVRQAANSPPAIVTYNTHHHHEVITNTYYQNPWCAILNCCFGGQLSQSVPQPVYQTAPIH